MMDDKQVLEELKKNPTESLVMIGSNLMLLEGAKKKGLTTIDEVIEMLKLLATEIEKADK